MNKCCGCGSLLQFDKPSDQGYSPKKDAIYCQRCFRLQNYGEFNYVIKPSLNNEEILQKVATINGVILWVVDIFDFESCLTDDYFKYLNHKELILVLTKRDLLPKTLSDKKIIDFINKRLKNLNINVKGIMITGFKSNKEKLYHDIINLSNGLDIVVIGNANAGKSTLLNYLITKNKLTVSRYPNTTLEFNIIKDSNNTFIDTPGLNQSHSLINNINYDDIRFVNPISIIKPKVYQIYEDMSFAIGGLARIDLSLLNNVSVVFYVSNNLLIHRGKLSNADELWEKHYGEMLVPRLNDEYSDFISNDISLSNNFDVCIYGLGWISIKGDLKNLKVITGKDVKVIKREVLI